MTRRLFANRPYGVIGAYFGFRRPPRVSVIPAKAGIQRSAVRDVSLTFTLTPTLSLKGEGASQRSSQARPNLRSIEIVVTGNLEAVTSRHEASP